MVIYEFYELYGSKSQQGKFWKTGARHDEILKQNILSQKKQTVNVKNRQN